jgi:Flp pilus assembly protein TadD
MTEIEKSEVDLLKEQGNKALEAGDCELAIQVYTKAIELSPLNHILYRLTIH